MTVSQILWTELSKEIAVKTRHLFFSQEKHRL
nr:MAG TPA: hypothetical protein [Caudoviricetes sp.]